MINPFRFMQEARNEIRKVTWPTRSETMVSTIMVLIMATIVTLLFALVDMLIRFGLSGLMSIFS